MKENKSYNKVILLSLTFLIVFLLQFILSLVQNIILMFTTYFMLSFFLLMWRKDKRITFKHKLIICLISFLIISSFLIHNYQFIEARSYFLGLWVISILSLILPFLFSIIKNRE